MIVFIFLIFYSQRQKNAGIRLRYPAKIKFNIPNNKKYCPSMNIKTDSMRQVFGFLTFQYSDVFSNILAILPACLLSAIQMILCFFVGWWFGFGG